MFKISLELTFQITECKRLPQNFARAAEARQPLKLEKSQGLLHPVHLRFPSAWLCAVLSNFIVMVFKKWV